MSLETIGKGIIAGVIGVVCLVPVWWVGRWVTKYDHPEDHRDIAWNITAGTMMIGVSALVIVIIWGIGRIVLAALGVR